jgi:hypothetical protein
MKDSIDPIIEFEAYKTTSADVVVRKKAPAVINQQTINLAKLLNQHQYICGKCGSDWVVFHALDHNNNPAQYVVSYCYQCERIETVWDGYSDDVIISGEFK